MQMWRWRRDAEQSKPVGETQQFDPSDIAALKQLAAKCTPAPSDDAKPEVIGVARAAAGTIVRSTQLNVRVQSETRRRAQALAAGRGTSLAEVIERAVDDLFSREAGTPR